jgi:hypothetical protein
MKFMAALYAFVFGHIICLCRHSLVIKPCILKKTFKWRYIIYCQTQKNNILSVPVATDQGV